MGSSDVDRIPVRSEGRLVDHFGQGRVDRLWHGLQRRGGVVSEERGGPS